MSVPAIPEASHLLTYQNFQTLTQFNQLQGKNKIGPDGLGVLKGRNIFVLKPDGFLARIWFAFQKALGWIQTGTAATASVKTKLEEDIEKPEFKKWVKETYQIVLASVHEREVKGLSDNATAEYDKLKKIKDELQAKVTPKTPDQIEASKKKKAEDVRQQLVRQKAQLDSDLVNAKISLEQSNGLLVKANSEKQALDAKIGSLEAKAAGLERELQISGGQLLTAKSQLETANNEKTRLEETLKKPFEIEEVKVRLDKLVKSTTEAYQKQSLELAALREQLQAAEEAKRIVIAEKGQVAKTGEELQTKVGELQQRLEDLERQKVKLEQALAKPLEIPEVKTAIAERVESQLNKSAKAIDDLSARFLASDTEVKRLKSALAEAATIKTQRENELAELTKKNETLVLENTKDKLLISLLEKQAAVVDAVQKEIQPLNNKIKEKDLLITQLNQKVLAQEFVISAFEAEGSDEENEGPQEAPSETLPTAVVNGHDQPNPVTPEKKIRVPLSEEQVKKISDDLAVMANSPIREVKETAKHVQTLVANGNWKAIAALNVAGIPNIGLHLNQFAMMQKNLNKVAHSPHKDKVAKQAAERQNLQEEVD